MALAMLALVLAGCASGMPPIPPSPDVGTASPSSDVASKADALATQAVRSLIAGDHQTASRDINQALQLRVDKSYYHLINALSYHLQAKEGDRAAFDLADQGYAQAIRFDASNWMAYYFRGRMKVDLGRFEQALPDLAEALMFRPEDTEVLSAFAYCAYRSGHPDLAAGALNRIESTHPSAPPGLVWRNAAMALAALNDGDRAAAYLDRYAARGAKPQDMATLRRRLEDWKAFHQAARPVPAQYMSAPYYGGTPLGSPSAPTTGEPSAPTGGVNSLTAEDRVTAPNTADKMVVIDVIMIATQENIATSRGLNLLSGLSLQFGGLLPSGLVLPTYSFSRERGGAGQTSTTTLTRALTVPSITYTLNILNASNQRSEVLARPTLIGLAGKQSDFFSGLELNAAAVAGGTSAAGAISFGGGQAVNIEKDIGVKLSVVPTILEDGRVKLAVSAQRTFLEAPSSDVNFTFKIETSKNQINAHVVMHYGETLILGGLSEKETQYTRDGVPILQDTPLLQYLFSHEVKSDFQKSVLVLLTPRLPQYVYQTDKARTEYEKSLSEDERPLANLQARYSDWFKPYPNWASVFHHLQDNSLYREFRTGDVDLESWSDMRSLRDRLKQALEFMHY